MARINKRNICIAIVLAIGFLLITNPAAAGILDPESDIKVNGSDGPIDVGLLEEVVVTIQLDPGVLVGQKVDWYGIAELDLGVTSMYFSIIYPSNIALGVRPYWQFRLIPIPTMEVYRGILPPGTWILHFGVDNNGNGVVEGTYSDSIEVNVGPIN